MVKLIAIDMDGTLLTPNHQISERNVKAIRAAMDSGIEVVIATGRAFLDAMKIVESTGLKVPYICLNGAEVRNKEHEVLRMLSLDNDMIKKIVSELDSESLNYNVYTHERVYTEDLEMEIEQYQHFIDVMGGDVDARERIMWRVEHGHLQEIEDFNELYRSEDEVILKFLAKSTRSASLLRAQNNINEFEDIYATSSGPGNIEVTRSEAQKGLALKAYAESLNIDLTECMAIGDNYNDLSMLKIVGHSVAMGNASSDIKSYATHVTETNIEDGVALAIESILEEKS